jgi:hypothetical protein
MRNPCDNHEDFATRITTIETKLEAILDSLKRIEERVYQSYGLASKLAGSFGALLAVAGVAAAIGAAIAKAL